MDSLRDDNKYKLKVDIEIDNALKQLRQIKKEVKEVVKECDYELNKLSLKRKDMLVVKLNGIYKQSEIKRIEKEIRKKLNRKVLVINQGIELAVIEK